LHNDDIVFTGKVIDVDHNEAECLYNCTIDSVLKLALKKYENFFSDFCINNNWDISSMIDFVSGSGDMSFYSFSGIVKLIFSSIISREWNVSSDITFYQTSGSSINIIDRYSFHKFQLRFLGITPTKESNYAATSLKTLDFASIIDGFCKYFCCNVMIKNNTVFFLGPHIRDDNVSGDSIEMFRSRFDVPVVDDYILSRHKQKTSLELQNGIKLINANSALSSYTHAVNVDLSNPIVYGDQHTEAYAIEMPANFQLYYRQGYNFNLLHTSDVFNSFVHYRSIITKYEYEYEFQDFPVITNRLYSSIFYSPKTNTTKVKVAVMGQGGGLIR